MENDLVNTQIRHVSIVGTGLIRASWTAQYLASGFDVIATDPAPNAEADLRKRVDEHGSYSLSLALLRVQAATG